MNNETLKLKEKERLAMATKIDLADASVTSKTAKTKIELHESVAILTVTKKYETIQQVVKLHKPFSISQYIKLHVWLSSLLFLVTLVLVISQYLSVIILLFLAIVYVVNAFSHSLRVRRFNALHKEITYANIVHREVSAGHDDKGGTSYAHYLTYTFEVPKVGTLFFRERVSQTVYDQLDSVDQIKVEYASAEPWLARRC